MHYKNGKPAKVGDKVVVNDNGNPLAGIVIEVIPGSTTCNLRVVPVTAPFSWVTASNALLVEDAFADRDPAQAAE